MRVTENILFSNFLYNINKINSDTYKTNSQMSSGRRLLNLDTDPISLMKVLSLKDIQSRFAQYTTNINSANSVLDTQDTALNNVDGLLQKADSLLIQGANAVNSDQTSRRAIAQQLDAIKKEIINSANTIFEGKYIFGGLKTDTKPIQDKPQAVAVTNQNLSDPNQVVEIETTEAYKDINQFEDGNYTIKIKDGKLYVCKDGCPTTTGGVPTNPIPIDENSEDNSNVNGNILATSIDLTNENIKDKIENNGWIDTGRGIKIRLKDMDSSSITTFDATIDVSYTSGGKSIYAGDDGHREVEYSDGLTSPITLNAKEIYKPHNQVLQNSNFMIDESTNDPVTEESYLTDISLNEALSRVKLEVGSTITINGSDHNGNYVSGAFAVGGSTTFQSLIDYVKTLDSIEIQKNNKTLVKTDGTIASSADHLSDLGINSNVDLFGYTASGASVSIAVAPTDTISHVLSQIELNFHVGAEIKHGIIELKGLTPGENKLNIFAQTHTNKQAVFGSFIETSKGASGGFKDTVDGYVKNGHLSFEDKRPGESKFNISFSIKDSSGSPASNVFGVFNVSNLGRGVDVFKELRNASQALLDENSVNQIGKPTKWEKGSSYNIKLSGNYLGGIDDNWTVKVTDNATDIHTTGGELKFDVVNQQSETVANVDLINNGSEYELTVKNKDDIIIQHVKDSDLDKILSKIVIETGGYQTIKNKDSVNGINGTQGVTLNFSKVSNNSTFQTGDMFSFKVSNGLERAIEQVRLSLGQVLTSRAVVGARTNRMTLAKERIDSIKITNSKTISELEDANIAEVFADFQRNQIVMQATLNAGSKISSRNLFDYLR